MANRDLSKAEWLDKAESYCAKAEHCAADVRRKLYEWGTPTDFFDFIEENLYSNGFLDDTRFCAAYVHDKVEYQSWGRLKIQAALRALQLPESEISQALKNIDENVYFGNLRKLIHSRSSDSEDKRLRFLSQRGYTFDEIRKCSDR
jgi:regulatory protein